ncbi:MAG TPA: dihydrolipoyllysine-residue succinyltransferase [Gemmataceae bacterium]|nr:dihydrolipoyllysine-residue succinyltransferase [Gemmataceae bacterium]
MAVPIKVPTIGESITEGTIVSWHKKNGDFVREGDPLFELETEKATTTIPAPASGTLQITAKEDATVAIGAVVGQIDDSAKSPAAEEKKPAPAAQPVARSEIQQPPAPPAAPAPTQAPVETHEPVKPSTPSGGGERRQRMSAIRQRIAERLLASQKNTATLTTFNEADMSAVIALRTRYKESFKDKHQVNLGFMPFFVKACVSALKAFPVVNAFLDGSDIVFHDSYHIGVAVSTEKGLMVPVLRDTDRMSFAQIDQVIADLAAKARDGKIAVQDLQGGTFTITNGGVFGSLLSTPILNPPQSAILGMHTIQKRPIAVDDQVVIRPMMYLALSYDHRLIDGREAVQFLVRVKECVERPERLLLEV